MIRFWRIAEFLRKMSTWRKYLLHLKTRKTEQRYFWQWVNWNTEISKIVEIRMEKMCRKLFYNKDMIQNHLPFFIRVVLDIGLVISWIYCGKICMSTPSWNLVINYFQYQKVCVWIPTLISFIFNMNELMKDILGFLALIVFQ